MKYFITKVLKFILILPFVYILGIWILSYIPRQNLKKNILDKTGAYGYMHTRIKEADSISQVDILVLGSSHAYRGVDPRVGEKKGYSIFNLGSSGQSHIQTHQLLKQYLSQLDPKLVVYEVYPSILETDGVGSALDLVANGNIDRYTLEMVLNINHIKVYNSFILRLYNDLIGAYDEYSESLVGDKDTYVSGGFVEKHDYEFFSQREDALDSIVWNTNEKQVEAFRANVSLIHEKEISLLLVFYQFNFVA